jgi:predicted solute-binding protein
MIKFNQLYIDNQGLNLIVDASITSESYYSNIYLKQLVIKDSNGEVLHQETLAAPSKSFYATIPVTAIGNIKNKLLLLTFDINGSMPYDVPCGYDIPDSAVYVDLSTIMPTIKLLTKEIANKCELPRNFLDYYMRFKGLEYAVRCKDYTGAQKFLDMLLETKIQATKTCSCHG